MDYTIREERLTAEEYISKIGMTRPHDMVVYDHAEWTSLTVE